ncbi:MAG: hypothetical protein JNK40_02930 [Chromatiales bacterium]|nr:hypothetical protein [Chromatiales bacterium]
MRAQLGSRRWRDVLSPRRLWLWLYRRPEIEAAFESAVPTPYDLAAMLYEGRTGVVLQSPPRLAVFRSKEVAHGGPGSPSEPPSAPGRPGGARIPDGWVAGGEALGLYGANTAEKFLAVDGHVYETMERLGADRIASVTDLSQSLGSWEHSVWTGIDPGGLNKFAGHLGEVYAAENLTAAGVSVQWPDASNQPGWDLLVAGHEVNVKTVTDVAGLKQHFALHPDIPVLVPGDMSNVPVDAFHLYPGDTADEALKRYLETHGDHAVIVDHELSHQGIFEQASDAADVAVGGAGVIETQMPWFTLATAGWREVELLRKQKTEALSAVKNLGIDVALRGGGAAGVGKAGAVLGGVFGGPIGALILGVAGAVIGGVLGSKWATEAKMLPLKTAVRKLDEANATLSGRAAALQAEAERSYASARAAEEAILKETAYREKKALADEMARLKTILEGAGTVPPAQARAVTAEALEEIRQVRDAIRKSLDQYNWLRRLLWPTARIVGLEIADRHCAEANQSLEGLGTMTAANDGECRRSQLHGVLAQFGLARARVLADVQAVEDQRRLQEAHVRTYFAGMYRRLASGRAQASQRLGRKIERLARELRETLAPLVHVCSQRAEAVSVEAGKLGMS